MRCVTDEIQQLQEMNYEQGTDLDRQLDDVINYRAPKDARTRGLRNKIHQATGHLRAMQLRLILAIISNNRLSHDPATSFVKISYRRLLVSIKSRRGADEVTPQVIARTADSLINNDAALSGKGLLTLERRRSRTRAGADDGAGTPYLWRVNVPPSALGPVDLSARTDILDALAVGQLSAYEAAVYCRLRYIAKDRSIGNISIKELEEVTGVERRTVRKVISALAENSAASGVKEVQRIGHNYRIIFCPITVPGARVVNYDAMNQDLKRQISGRKQRAHRPLRDPVSTLSTQRFESDCLATSNDPDPSQIDIEDLPFDILSPVPTSAPIADHSGVFITALNERGEEVFV